VSFDHCCKHVQDSETHPYKPGNAVFGEVFDPDESDLLGRRCDEPIAKNTKTLDQ